VLLMVVPLLALFLAQSHVPGVDVSAAQCASLLANLSALTLDFAARQKLGGTTLNYFYLKQFPVLHTRSYGGDHLKFIVPRVLDQPGRPSATAARRPPIRPRRPPGGMIVTIHGNPSHGT